MNKIPLTAAFIGSNTVRLNWTHPLDAPHGVTIVRAPGTHTVDGNNRPPDQPEYDPMTIAGAQRLATRVMASPYLNTDVPLGPWTYWVARSGG